MISSEYTYTNLPNQMRIFQGHLVKEGKHGKKVDLVTIRIPSFLMPKNLESQNSKGQADAKKRSDVDYGRFVHGIKKAFATCVPIVGFSFNLRIEYSYHFSPYGM